MTTAKGYRAFIVGAGVVERRGGDPCGRPGWGYVLDGGRRKRPHTTHPLPPPLQKQNRITQKGDKRNPLWYDLSGIDVIGGKGKIMSNHACDDILNYVVDKIQKLAPDEQEWLLENLTKLVREKVTNSKYTYTFEEARHYVIHLKSEEQLELFKFLAGSVLQKASIGPQHNVMEFRGAAKDFWQGVDVEKYIEEERNSWE